MRKGDLITEAAVNVGSQRVKGCFARVSRKYGEFKQTQHDWTGAYRLLMQAICGPNKSREKASKRRRELGCVMCDVC